MFVKSMFSMVAGSAMLYFIHYITVQCLKMEPCKREIFL